jgi:hypothetical protein
VNNLHSPSLKTLVLTIFDGTRFAEPRKHVTVFSEIISEIIKEVI